jgi:hypothetical protein
MANTSGAYWDIDAVLSEESVCISNDPCDLRFLVLLACAALRCKLCTPGRPLCYRAKFFIAGQHRVPLVPPPCNREMKNVVLPV